MLWIISIISVIYAENFDFTERLLFGIGFRPHRNLEILGKRKVGLRIRPKRILAKGQALASMKPAFATLRLGKPEGAAKVEGAPPLRITPLRRTGWFKPWAERHRDDAPSQSFGATSAQGRRGDAEI